MKNGLKRASFLLLALAILLTGIPIAVSAEASKEQEAVLDAANGVGYSQADAEAARINLASIQSLAGVSSPSASSYKIDSIAAYTNFVSLVNNGNTFSGKTVYLAANLDLSSVANQQPIGFRRSVDTAISASAAFSGTLDGQGYAIRGIRLEYDLDDHQYLGFIGWADGATVKNLVLSGTVKQTVGGHTGSSDYCGVGGVIGSIEPRTSGTNPTTRIQNVYSSIDVSGPRQAGGIVGRGWATVNITQTTNAGSVTGGHAGGFTGYILYVTIQSCLNKGSVYATANKAGGFIARAIHTSSIANSVNDGAVTAPTQVSGFIGCVEAGSGRTVTLTKCTNYGPFTTLQSDSASNSETVSNVFGNVTSGTLTVSEDCVDATRAGYDAGLVYPVDLSGVADITTLADTATPDATSYKITNAEGLVKLSVLVDNGNTFNGINVYLANDVDMSGVSFTPIGYAFCDVGVDLTTRSFQGLFDGQGHKITNLAVSLSENTRSGLGLFGCAEGAIIRNLIIDESCSFTLNVNNGYNAVGAFIGYSTTNCGASFVKNVVNRASVTGPTHSAGIVGRGGRINVSYYTNYGHIKSSGNSVASVSGYGVNGNLSHSVNYGTVEGTRAGGFTTRTNNANTYENLVNYGAVLSPVTAAGILGEFESSTTPNATVKRCRNYGAVCSTDGDAILGSIYAIKAGASDANIVLTDCSSASISGADLSLVLPRATDGLVDLKQYDAIPDEIAYKITDGAGLVKLASLVNGGNTLEGVTIFLANDIDMRSVAMIPIGTVSNPFGGIFDGQGHLICSLDLSVDGTAAGLFGSVYGATVCNLVLDENSTVIQTGASAGSVGAIVASATNATLANLQSFATVNATGSAAGILGSGSADLFSCTNNGKVTSNAGAAGVSYSVDGKMIACVNAGAVTGNTVAGGVLGEQNVAGTLIVSSLNRATVDGKAYAGGLIGIISNDCGIYNCANYGAVITSSSACNRAENYNVTHEKGSNGRYIAPAITGTGCVKMTAVGYSTKAVANSKVRLASLIESGIALNIEDYVYNTHKDTVKILVIDSASDMVLFSRLINTETHGEGMTFYLASDIDMSGYSYSADAAMTKANTYAPVGWDRSKTLGELTDASVTVSGKPAYFAGVFDGQGYSIKNLKMATADTQKSYLGVFGYLNGATVRNLVLDKSCSFHTSVYVDSFKMGALAGGAENSTVENVWVQPFVGGKGIQVGGFIGRATDVSFIGCTNSSNVTGLDNVGGFVGFGSGKLTYYNCRNLGNVSGTTRAGGFTARDGSEGYYVNCVNVGNVSAHGYAGAIVGTKWQSGTTYYAGCSNYGAITGGYGTGADSDLLFGKGSDASCKFEELTDYPTKNVDEYHVSEMLDVKFQLKDNANGTFNLRLVTTVDSANYGMVVFHFIYANKDKGIVDTLFETDDVYTSVLGGELVYTPETFADTSKYFAVQSITGIPNQFKADFTPATKNFTAQAFLVTQNGDTLGKAPLEDIEVPKTYSASTTAQGTVIHIDSSSNSLLYTIPGTSQTVNRNYQGWPSVTADENGVLYAVSSARISHTDPYGCHIMSKSTDGGVTWSKPVIINDTPVDDRDIGIEYLGNGKMVANYFRTGAAKYLSPAQSFYSADGVYVKGDETYPSWRNASYYGGSSTKANACVEGMINYWKTCNYEDLTSCNVTLVSYDYGNTWSEEIIGGPQAPHGSIGLSNGDLLYVGLASGGVGAHFSNDGGYTWAYQAMIFPSGAINYCEPHVVELPNGRLLAAARANDRSTLTVSGTVYTFVGYGLNGQAIFELSGSYYQISHDMKTVTKLSAKPTCYNTYYMATSYSDDGGATWSTPRPVKDKSGTLLWGSPPEFEVTDEGLVVLTYAVRAGGPNTGVNKNYTEYAIVSYDGGESWDTPILLHTRSTASGTSTDLGYPSTVYLGNGNFVTIYYQALSGESNTSILYTKWKLTNTASSTGSSGAGSGGTQSGLYPVEDGYGTQEDWADLNWS